MKINRSDLESEKAKSVFNSVITISYTIFIKVASYILPHPIELIEIYRCTMGEHVGQLSIIIYKDSKYKFYYDKNRRMVY